METKKLRQKILDLAIHGKLVPQDPNDEPASILLERIRVEKERLIKEGKIKRTKKAASDTPHYENRQVGEANEMPFEVPEGWEWTTINDICSKIGSGSTPRGSNYAKEGIPFFRSQNVYNDGLVYDDIKYISEEVHENMIGTEVRAKDLLLNITGGSLGRCAIVPDEFQKGNVSQHVCILRTIIVLPAYLHLFIISDYFAATMILSGSGREGLPKYSLETMQFPLPPIEEQKRIVAAVNKWFALIDTLETAKEDLQTSITLAKSKILDLAIHGKLVPQDPNNEPAIELLKRINPKFTPCDNAHYPFDVPHNWVWAKGLDIFKPMKATSPLGDTFKYIDIDAIDNKRNVVSSVKVLNTKQAPSRASRYTEKGCVLFSMVRPYLRNIAMVTENDCIASTGFFVCQGKGCLLPKFCYYQMLSNYVVDGLNDFMKGDNSPSITKAQIEEYIFPLPPYNEQQRIVTKIEELLAVLDKIQKSIEA